MRAMNGNKNRIESIVIVGGGTAGWLSAAYLNRALGPGVKITVVESPTIQRIGVGEATVSTLRYTMAFLGLADEDWMPHCNATYKTAIRFADWNRPPTEGAPPDHYDHPFFERREDLVKPFGMGYFPERGEGISICHYWHARHLAGDREPFASACFSGPAICDARLSPREIGSRDYALFTAYHLDAFLVGDFLRDLSVARGVEHVRDDVIDVTLDECGFIASVSTRGGRTIEGQLFLDCTGFRGLLINGALKVPFVSEGRSLLCDSAVAMPAAHHPPERGLAPFTTSTARGAGWIWEIPLYHRYGTGYVYSSRFESPEGAERELRTFLGGRADDSPANHLNMRVGRNARMWEKNCVAVGLSGCFVEPLESTTIFLIEYTLANLVTYFPDKRFAAPRAEQFNRTMQDMFEEIRDFIILHYVLANRRETPFWKAVHEETLIPDSLKEKLAYLGECLPMLDHFSNFVFRERSYTCVLAGLGKLPPSPLPLLAHLDPRLGEERFAEARRKTADLVSRLPGHREYLSWMYERARAPHAESPGRAAAAAIAAAE
jgi:tryptophan halogenase